MIYFGFVDRGGCDRMWVVGAIDIRAEMELSPVGEATPTRS